MGLCFGELAAAAVCLANSLTELLPLAVEAVRVAFRAGIIINITGDELEHKSESPESWSIALSRDSGLANDDNLKDICKQLVSCSERQKTCNVDAERIRRVSSSASSHTSPLSVQRQ